MPVRTEFSVSTLGYRERSRRGPPCDFVRQQGRRLAPHVSADGVFGKDRELLVMSNLHEDDMTDFCHGLKEIGFIGGRLGLPVLRPAARPCHHCSECKN
jgi:hypothetical protein